jgi:hypothetical protein
MARFSVPRNVWDKITMQAGKEGNEDLQRMLGTVKVTRAPDKAAIIWEPSNTLLGRIKDVLTREESFMRKKDSTNHKNVVDSIKRIERLLTAPAEA